MKDRGPWFGNYANTRKVRTKCVQRRRKSYLAKCILTGFDRIVSSCQTLNQLNSVLIRLENQMSPAEEGEIFRRLIGFPLDSSRLRHLLYAVRLKIERAVNSSGKNTITCSESSLDFRLRQWAHSLWQHSRMADLRPFDDFVPVWRRGGSCFFRCSKRSDGLIICFTAAGNRMGIRTPTLLRFLRPYSADVLLVVSKGRGPYSSGFGGFPGDFFDGVSAVVEMIRDAGYRKVVTFGASKGALPAIVGAGHLDHADGVLVMGLSGFDPAAPGEKLVSGPLNRPVLRKAWNKVLAGIPIHLVFGSDSLKDDEAAHRIAKVLPNITVEKVPDSPHAVIWPLALRGQLSGLLERSLHQWLSDSSPMPDEEESP